MLETIPSSLCSVSPMHRSHLSICTGVDRKFGLHNLSTRTSRGPISIHFLNTFNNKTGIGTLLVDEDEYD